MMVNHLWCCWSPRHHEARATPNQAIIYCINIDLEKLQVYNLGIYNLKMVSNIVAIPWAERDQLHFGTRFGRSCLQDPGTQLQMMKIPLLSSETPAINQLLMSSWKTIIAVGPQMVRLRRGISRCHIGATAF